MAQRKKTVYLIVVTCTINRLFRIILSYLNERLCRIRNEFWKTGGDSHHINEFLDQSEKDFFFQYKNNISVYQNSFPIDLNLITDLEPPQDLYIEIRVLEDCGEILTTKGETLLLERNSTLLVRRCDVEHLLKQNMVIQTK